MWIKKQGKKKKKNSPPRSAPENRAFAGIFRIPNGHLCAEKSCHLWPGKKWILCCARTIGTSVFPFFNLRHSPPRRFEAYHIPKENLVKRTMMLCKNCNTNNNAELLVQGCVRYGTYRGVPPVYTAGITGTGLFFKFGTTSVPAPDTSVSSVRHQYRYRKLW